MKKYLLLINALVISFASHAGGSWSPAIGPDLCIKKQYDWNTFTGFMWDNSTECNDVIEKGYAKGVHYSGTFVTIDDENIPLDGYITPYQSYNPDSIKGKKLKDLLTNKIEWAY